MRCLFAVVSLLGLLGSACQMSASSITIVPLGTLSTPVTNSGTLPDQTQVIEETFTTSAPTAFTAFTTSYGGGTNLNGSTAIAGGFEPMLSLYNSAGIFVAGEAVTSPIAKTDSATGLALDAYLNDPSLPAGMYILVLTDWLNQQPATATNLSDGFVDFGLGGNTFLDEQLNARTANYALNISASPASAVPEPATIWLTAVPIGFLGYLARKARAK